MSLAGDVIMEARSRARLSLRELAVRAGTSAATLSRYERGLIDPGMATVDRIVTACGLEIRIVLDAPDPGDRLAAAAMARLTVQERLDTLAAWGRLRGVMRT